ncbi:spore coat protein [Clostridium cadaveris]|nr:spore coat protein [Clostridium cadaveris]
MAEINSSISAYGSIIAQTENEQLRQTIQGMRNQDEIRQYALFK